MSNSTLHAHLVVSLSNGKEMRFIGTDAKNLNDKINESLDMHDDWVTSKANNGVEHKFRTRDISYFSYSEKKEETKFQSVKRVREGGRETKMVEDFIHSGDETT